MKLLRELYDYREMLVRLVKRDLRGRYKGSVLGFLWTFINPLLQLLVYTLVFSIVMRSGIEKYYLYVFVALVPWLFFGTCLTGGASCIWNQQDMVKKIYFPREILPLSFVISQFVNMLLSFTIIFAVLFVTGVGVNPVALLYLLPVMLVEFIMALGITMISSALTVYLRDLEYILGIVSMAWMYLSPVMYDISWVPEKYQKLYSLNPMEPIIVAYRDILYYKQVPQMETLLMGTIVGIVVLVIGCAVFSKLKRGFAEEL